MKYFIDTEFIEGFRKHGNRMVHFIDMISIGIQCEDGRSYYAISKEWDYAEASDWVKDNVIEKLDHTILPKSNRQIREELIKFFDCKPDGAGGYMASDDIEVYAYFADYDWVVFCSLFGRMIDLPKNFPMWCVDLKQMMWERGLGKDWKQQFCPDPTGEHNALVDAQWNQKLYNLISDWQHQKTNKSLP